MLRERIKVALGATALFVAGCSPFSAAPGHSIDASGSGPGTASGMWTDHFTVTKAPWTLMFRVNCTRASKNWNVDLTLEKMYQDNYFQAVPIGVGWGRGTGPRAATVLRRVRTTGEFWFIVYSDEGCNWRVKAPSSPA